MSVTGKVLTAKEESNWREPGDCSDIQGGTETGPFIRFQNFSAFPVLDVYITTPEYGCHVVPPADHPQRPVC